MTGLLRIACPQGTSFLTNYWPKSGLQGPQVPSICNGNWKGDMLDTYYWFDSWFAWPQLSCVYTASGTHAEIAKVPADKLQSWNFWKALRSWFGWNSRATFFTKAPERHQSFIQPSSTSMPGHKGSSSNIRFSGTPSQRRWQIPSYSNQSGGRRVCSHHRTPAGSPTAALSKDTLGTSHDLPGSGGPPGGPMQLLSACKWSCALQICTCNLRIDKPRFVGCTNVLSDTLPSRSRNNRPGLTRLDFHS